MTKKRTSVFLSATCGNILEYFDFTVYSIFSIEIGKAFFSGESELVQTLSSLAVFAVGFLTRPVGGIFFGYIGDRYGRRIALILSMLGMTIPTFMIGLIPTSDQIGYMAPLLLLSCRLMQGLCISGEGAGAAIFVLEHYNNLRPGLITGIVHGSNTAGILLAAFVGILIEKHYAHLDFAWRFAFLLGGFMGLVGFYLRLRVSETPIFEELLKRRGTLKSPLFQVFRTAWPSMFLTFCVGAVTSSVVYLVKNVNVFYKTVLHLPNSVALNYLFFSSLVLMCSMPIFGGMTDVFGRRKMIIFSVISIIFAAIPTFFLMSSPLLWQQIIGLILLGAAAGSISGTAYIFVISLFTPQQRFSGVAFSYNLGIALFGGTAPMITTWLSKYMAIQYNSKISAIAPAFYIIMTSGLFLVILYFMHDWLKNREAPEKN